MRKISSLVPLPPELQLIIQTHLNSHLHQTKFKSIKSKIESKLYFWIHKEQMYNIDFILFRFMDFSDFRPIQTPVGILKLPMMAYIPITPITI